MTHGRFNENLYLDSDFWEIWKKFKYETRLSNITVLEHSLNFDFRKYGQKCMTRQLQSNMICDSQVRPNVPQISKCSCRISFRGKILLPRAIFSRSRVKFNDRFARASWAWALATRFSFTCCVAGYCLVGLCDWRPHDMLCFWQHPATMLPARAAIRQTFGPKHCSSEAFFECSFGSVSGAYVSKLSICQCSWMLEESASHPTSPFVFGKGSATSLRRHNTTWKLAYHPKMTNSGVRTSQDNDFQ